MRRLRPLLPILLAPALLCLGSGQARCAPRVSTVNATPIFRFVTALTAGGTFTFRSDNLSPGGDTVLHLVRARDMVEVARNDDRAPGQPASTVTYTVPAIGAGDYWVLVRARTAATAGTCDFTGNGVVFTGVRFGGVPVAVDNGPGFVFETALQPGGSPDTRLLALDNTGRVVAFSDDEGVGLASRIRSDLLPPIGEIVVGSYSAASGGVTRLYTNDTASDRDRDGLGSALELALGTCDDAADPGCAQVVNLKDTDRDGLEDALELFGLDDAAQPLYLPMWGADPRHKDIFVEADSLQGQPLPAVTEAKAVQIAAAFAAGPAADLVNPDGRDGVSVHIDAGVTPADPANATKIGNWGGASFITNNNRPADDLGANRAGLFFQAMMSPSATGCSGGGTAFSWSGAVATFNHELAHCLSLNHEGPTDRSWGLNCSPIRRSTMSYAAATFPVAGFSDGTIYGETTLNPNRLCEEAGLGNDQSSHLLAEGWALPDADKRRIDWNRDGEISDCGHPVRAPINWLPSNACDTHIQNELRLSPANVISPPALAQMGTYLYAFYIDNNQSLRYRRSVQHGSFRDGGCPHGSKPGSLCSGWAADVQVFEGSVTSVNAFSVDGRIYLSLVRPGSNEIQTMFTQQQDASGFLQGWSAAQPVQGSNAAVAGEMGVIYVDRTIFGVDRLVGMIWPDRISGTLTWGLLDPVFQIYRVRGGLTDANNVALGSGGVAPTLAFWGEDNLTATGNHLTYMAVTNANRRLRIYRYFVNNKWTDVTAAVFPGGPPTATIKNKMGFAFRPLTDADGQIMDPLKGEFSLLFADPTQAPPILAVSEVVDGGSKRNPSLTLRFTRVGIFGHPSYPGGAVLGGYDLFASPTLPYLKAVLTRQSNELWVLPHADGIFDKDFVDRSEFLLMERGVCLGLRQGSTVACGMVGLNGY